MLPAEVKSLPNRELKITFRKRINPDYGTCLRLAGEMHSRGRLHWGRVSRLSERNGVSRSFLYRNEARFVKLAQKKNERRAVVRDCDGHRLILTTRLNGNSSIDGIAKTLVDMGYSPCSTGHVSEFLAAAAKVCPEAIHFTGKAIVLLIDEIFCNGDPIFVVLEAASHCILSIRLLPDRKAKTWEDELRRLQDAGVEIMMVVKDQENSLKAAAKTLKLKERADLFHLLHPFDSSLPRFERCAYSAIAHESDRARVFGGRKREQALEKCLADYDAACRNTLQAMRACDNYNLLHLWLHGAFDSFTVDGRPRTRSMAEGDILAILSMMEDEFGHHADTLAAIKFLRAALPDFLDYFDQLESIIAGQPKTLPEHTLRAVSLSWQLEKKAMAVKNQELKKMLGQQAREQMDLALIGADETRKNAVNALLAELGSNVRSSSPLEAINSIIRRYLNACRGMTTQGALNMLAFFLNHRVANRGKYAGTSPCQRLTGVAEKGTPIEQILQRLSQAAKKPVEPASQSALSIVA